MHKVWSFNFPSFADLLMAEGGEGRRGEESAGEKMREEGREMRGWADADNEDESSMFC